MTDRSSSLLRPRHLVEGDVVRVVAPSSPFDEADFQAGVTVLESWGFQPRWRDDITDRRERELRLEHLAHHDALTGLANRNGFSKKLEAVIARGHATVFAIDLDRYGSQ